MKAMRVAGQLYHAMGSIEEAKIDGFNKQTVLSAVRRSLSELESAREHLADALGLIPQLVTFLRQNWDEEYERLLRDTGFRGSLFILRDYKVHLELIQLSLDSQIEAHRASLRDLEDDAQQPSPFNPLLETTTRGLCRSLIRFLDFEEQMAQSQVVNITRFAADNVS